MTSVAEHPQTTPDSSKRHGSMPLNMVTSYHFFQVDPAFRLLPIADRQAALTAFEQAVAKHHDHLWIRSYSTFGIRYNSDFFLWNISKELEPIQALLTDMFRTPLGPYLRQTQTFLAVSKESEYTRDHNHPPPPELGEAKYLFIYPFVKTRDWYLLSFEERMRIMKEHIDVGHTFPEVTINTAYSFGIDDQDFVVAFDGNSLERFVQLVMRLRETESSRYTQRDTPMVVGLKQPLDKVIASLGLV